MFVWAPGTTDADFGRAQYLASFLGACSLTTTPATHLMSQDLCCTSRRCMCQNNVTYTGAMPCQPGRAAV